MAGKGVKGDSVKELMDGLSESVIGEADVKH